jgi:fumarate hydratase class II
MHMTDHRHESDTHGKIAVPIDKLWGAQTQRSLEHFSISDELMPREMILAYALIKKASAAVNHRFELLTQHQAELISKVCDEILTGTHHEHFPLRVWMTGSGTQFNMNINEVISNRICQLTGKPLGDKTVHPNDHVNKSQSTNDSFPTAMHIATALGVKKELLPEVKKLRDALARKVEEWQGIIKIGRTHMQDATPITLSQEFSSYVGMLDDNLEWIEQSLNGVYRLALGGTAVGTGINAPTGFDKAVAEEVAKLTGLPFVTAPNKFTVQGSHDTLVHLSGTLKTLANSCFKIAGDIQFLSCGPRCGISEIRIPENEPGSSIMPGKVNPTQCEAFAMLSLQVIANDLAVTLGGCGGSLEMNVYKPLIIHNLLKSIRLLRDGCRHFRLFLVEGMEPNRKQIESYLNRSLMLVTALVPLIGYDKASQIAKHAYQKDLTLKDAALELGFVTAEEFDALVDPNKMV